MGHHFRYRWRYRDTVHKAKGQQRPQLRPTEDEKTPDSRGCPSKLTGARLLFGYVGTSTGKDEATEPLTGGIGTGDFQQLAGRISCNMAVEQDDREPVGERFIGDEEHNFLVPLRPLGSPKPSAVEHYLTQDKVGKRTREDGGCLRTYGDTPDDESAGDLRGRKFYLHQPRAVDRRECYELTGPDCNDWKIGDSLAIESNQAAVGRFVSQPGRQFRFTIRFQHLRDWELSALLLALCPTKKKLVKLGDGLGLQAEMEEYLSVVAFQNSLTPGHSEEMPLLAMKLGHGRPLGLGSVLVQVEHLMRLVGADAETLSFVEDKEEGREEDKHEHRDTEGLRLVKQLGKVIKDSLGPAVKDWFEKVLKPWIEAHRFAGRTFLDYPRTRDTVFNYHSELRKAHAYGRKMKERPPEWPEPPLGLLSLDELRNRERT